MRFGHLDLNTCVKIGASWPTNRYGTSRRTITIWFDWSDQKIIWEAIETIDPLKVTAVVGQ